jgi:hypothetical protein
VRNISGENTADFRLAFNQSANYHDIAAMSKDLTGPSAAFILSNT